jgi:hypothetical protein
MCIWRYHRSSISEWKLHTDKNYNSIEMLLINHLSNRWYVIRPLSVGALSRGRFSSIIALSISPPDSRWTNSSHDGHQTNLWYRGIFPWGIQKCDWATIITVLRKRCQSSFVSISELSDSLFHAFWPRESEMATFSTQGSTPSHCILWTFQTCQCSCHSLAVSPSSTGTPSHWKRQKASANSEFWRKEHRSSVLEQRMGLMND